MLTSAIVRMVNFCVRHAWAVILVAIVLTTGSAVYVVVNFSIDTNIDNLMSPDLDWRKREIAYHQAFPQSTQLILVVVDGPTPELTAAASQALTQELVKKNNQENDLFRSVDEQAGGAFFRRNGLLYASPEQLEGMTSRLTSAAPLIGTLASDQSLRGLVQALSFVLAGVEQGQLALDDTERVLNAAAEPIEKVAAGQRADFSWKTLLQGSAQSTDLRRFIAVWPYLNHNELAPGARATRVIRQAIEDLKLDAAYRSHARITGPVPIADAEFASTTEGLALNSALTGAIIITILWIALASWRLVLAVVTTIAVGLIVTAGLGLLIVGALNPISVAFAILFVGLGADFAIQYTMRYRAQRHISGPLHSALIESAERVGAPLTLAAGAAAAGFLSFLPTPYVGIGQLGVISGSGMAVAYVASLTLLPALLWVLNPPEEPRSLRNAALAPVDGLLKRHRIAIIAATTAIVVLGVPALLKLQFDFNPLHLRDQSSEEIATLRDISKDPRAGANAAQVLTPSPEAAAAVAKRLASLPEVEQTRTIDSFIPAEQDRKLPLIQKAAQALNSALNRKARPAPNDQDNVAALRNGAAVLKRSAGDANGPGAVAARRLSDDLAKLANADQSQRAAVAAAFVTPLRQDLDELRDALQAGLVRRSDLPRELVRNWIGPDGQARAEALPKGNPDDDATLRRFAQAVLAAEPNATGQAVATLEWADTIVRSFLEAGAWALLSIALLLWIVLRRFGDVLLTLIPLIVAAVATLEICGVTNFPLNYANIVALPVLLGVGVAFKIYYIMAWRQGQTDFLQSALTRAVFYSALLTATSFGSLWFSSHPGTSSMGKLLFLSLVCTLASAVLFQPALMGAPRIAAAPEGGGGTEQTEPARRRGMVLGRFTHR
jgi:hopanoid biosynthesis associated RND transporter like protein HpnN